MPTAAAHNGSRLAAASKLWTGVGATLARDVPFSALYWGMVEPIRAALLPGSTHSRTEWQVFSANVTGEGRGICVCCVKRLVRVPYPLGSSCRFLSAAASPQDTMLTHCTSPAMHLCSPVACPLALLPQLVRWRAACPVPSPRPLMC